MDVWPTSAVIISDILHYLNTIEIVDNQMGGDSTHGQLKAHMVELENQDMKMMALAAQMQILQKYSDGLRATIEAEKGD